MGSLSSKSVNVASKVNFGNITFLELLTLISHRRVISANFVNTNTAWHSNTSLKVLRLLVAENLLELLLHEFVNFLANSVNIGIWYTLRDGKLKSLIRDNSSSLNFIENSWLVQESGLVIVHSMFVSFHF